MISGTGSRRQFPTFRYTSRIVKRILLSSPGFALCLCLVLGAISPAHADDESFQRVKIPDAKGKEIIGTLTFSDRHKAVEIRPVKGDPVSIPYGEIDRCAYEYTKQHRISEGSVAAVPIGLGVVLMLTHSKSHWLEIDYEEQNIRKAYVLRMDKHDYLRILQAFEDHTGKNPEVLGNADKRRR